MFKFLSNLFNNEISIDLGTANTLIYVKGKGIVLNEPTVVAVRHDKDSKHGYVVAVGKEAKKMIGRTPYSIETIRPMKDGVIADVDYTEKMLKYFLKSVLGRGFFTPDPKILISVPGKASKVERQAIKRAAENAGASEVYIIDEPMAAALGAGLPVDQATGSMVVDIGGGTTDIAIISLSGMVHAASVKIGGDRFNEDIITYIKKNKKVSIGEQTAERIKEQIGTAYRNSDDEIQTLDVRGRQLDGIPAQITINSDNIQEALSQSLSTIVQAVKVALDACPPELSADIAERGIVLTGGGALLRGLTTLLADQTGLPVIVAENPLECVAQGGGKALEMMTKAQRDIFQGE
ncbi:MAG: rod shape-determining protein [Succinivibrionaceae bacterium]|nr:rod shape-determining protein [Succinivibrionaceae bacterium]